ncbi:hypothetical protein RchiOBHm_Chr2g0095101 [Rosa chinensis]|uniref:Uncharacterized protein n=1 Tax=Rosa chinensis TaxID=74649 RepID=A0A2P6RKP9_ROSCH|nr:hypothetical protein RchiOBHm_Chr2g0095101 [Rosa chinensis]
MFSSFCCFLFSCHVLIRGNLKSFRRDLTGRLIICTTEFSFITVSGGGYSWPFWRKFSSEPNFRVSPFLFMPEGPLASAVSFCILWPIKNVEKGNECVPDYLFGIGEDEQRSARFTATPEKYFIRHLIQRMQKSYGQVTKWMRI